MTAQLAFIGMLAASEAPALDLVIPDRARLQAMSQGEYAAYREQVQARLDDMSTAERDLVRDSNINGRRQMESRNVAGSYGQGYGARSAQGVGRGGGYGRVGGRGR